MIHTQSSINTFQTCELKWRHRYRDGVSPIVESDALTFGTIWHEVMEGLLLGVLKKWAGPEAVINRAPLNDENKDKLTAMVKAYDERWADTWTTCSVEEVFTHEIDGMRFSGKYDAIVEQNGKRWVVEHKTTSLSLEEDSGYWAKLFTDWQVQLYYLAARAQYENVAGVIYDVVRKPALRLGKKDREDGGFGERVAAELAKNPDRYFQRKEITLSKERVASAENALATLAARIEKTRTHVPSPGACMQYGKPCPYNLLCQGHVEPSDKRYFEIRKIHEELEQ